MKKWRPSFVDYLLLTLTFFVFFSWNDAKAEIRLLNTQYDKVVATAIETNIQWKISYDKVIAQNEEWITSYNILKTTNKEWISAYNTLKVNNEQLTTNYNTLKTQNASLTQAAEDNKFYFYYIKPEQEFGVDNLDSFIRQINWNKKPYQENVFDCSEMSAALERKLEDAGFHTKIAMGKTPGKPETSHAWLLVETSPNKYMPVEATIPSVIWWLTPYFDDYFKYEGSFETIQEALKYSSTEFDWWKQ